MVRKKVFFRSAGCAVICALTFSFSGCGLADLEALFTDPAQLDAKARKNPAFWEAAMPVPQTDNLYELDNDFFLGKPYNDLCRFGDDILLVAEAYYGDAFSDEDVDLSAVEYEYSFDVYSPWRDKVLYSLRHQDIHCDSYQVIGDELFLFDYDNLELSVYDSRLKLQCSYDISELYGGEELTLYPTEKDTEYYVYSESFSEPFFINLQNSYIDIGESEWNFYGIQPGSVSDSREYFAIAGVDPLTLGYRLAVINNKTLATEYAIPGGYYFLGDVSNCAFVGLTNSSERFWVYRGPDGDNFFFRCDNACGAKAMNDGTFVLVQQDYETDVNDYQISFARYSPTGSDLSSFTYSCGDLSDDGVYLSNHQAYFEEEGIGFLLAYNMNLRPYLIVWDMNAPGENPCDLQFYSGEDELAASVPSYYYGAYEAENDTEYGYQVTNILNLDTYDWGALYSANQKATALEEKYGISIYLGPEVPEKIDHFYTKQQLNSNDISKALDDLEDALSCYPDNFFTQLAFGENRGIRIYLAGNITGDNMGVLEDPSGFVNEINSHMVMVLNTNYSRHWDYTIAHELSHMVDRRLEFRNNYVSGNLFSEKKWADYNPDDFEYLMSYDGYEDNNAYELYSDYFIDSYSVTFPTEDRAVLFGTAMSNYIKGVSNDDSFSTDSPTGIKYDYYCKCIRNGFDTTGWDNPVPWETCFNSD